MKVIYFDFNTAPLVVEIDMVPKGSLENVIKAVSTKFFSALFYEERNSKALEQLSKTKMYKFLTTFNENNLEFIQDNLFISSLEQKYLINIETNELLTSHAKGLEGSLFTSTVDDCIRLHYHNNTSIEEDLVEIGEPVMYRYIQSSQRYINLDIDEVIPNMFRKK